MKCKTAPLNDGLVTIYAVSNAAAPGDKPVEALTEKVKLRYQERTVGVRRYYAAMEANARIDLLLRVPYLQRVSAQDIAVPTKDGEQYRIDLVQLVPDSCPRMMDLTLRRVERDYEIS